MLKKTERAIFVCASDEKTCASYTENVKNI